MPRGILCLSECAENLKLSLCKTTSFSEAVCPVAVFSPAKTSTAPFRFTSHIWANLNYRYFLLRYRYWSLYRYCKLCYWYCNFFHHFSRLPYPKSSGTGIAIQNRRTIPVTVYFYEITGNVNLHYRY